ncbi:diguanylate cyclase [Alteromonas sp. V450]|uniref:RraA family protein n=1 Tax=Alteromonas sp. V450 TaxID=1912139 RepID=UPI0008FF4CFB|nr:RraA family protein [Alteromonas sp. V450]OJF69588.1 diguanylate cyclase [Alteromonas sp. V450]|tara:strand:+ start:303 stop:926 length:624 start_codon:yes stop_codon:yes gene_type:complete
MQTNTIPFETISPCDYADALPRQQFIDYAIKPLWSNIPRIAGPAFTVKCAPGDHLMLHAAIYRASPGDIIVVEADDNYAVAGGNVCAIAQSRGIKGFVIDGVIRDIAQTRENKFPVFARGVVPKPGAKKCVAPLNTPVLCGGVSVNAGDIVVADEEGIAVIPLEQAENVFTIAKARAEKDASMTLEQWREQHVDKVESTLKALGYSD